MHSLEDHMKNLESLCRMCASKMGGKSAKPKDCIVYKQSIWTVYAIDIQKDVQGHHPHKMCLRCHKTMCGYLKKDSNDGFPAQKAR